VVESDKILGRVQKKIEIAKRLENSLLKNL
jgi:hypothetical protein